MSTKELDQQFNDGLDQIRTNWNNLQSRIATLEADQLAEINQLKEKNAELDKKYQKAQAKVDKIEAQLANTLEQMESLSKTTSKGIDAMQLLDLYLVLMENVFESQMHTRLLIMLHGAKETYNLNELTTAAGISGVQVRQALFDLRNSGLVNYNEETQEISLVTRFM